LLFDLDGREGGKDRVDLHLLIRDVGHGVNGQPLQGIPPDAADHHGQEHDQQTVCDGEVEDTCEHGLVPLL
jgi:hypothetical protein